MVHDLLTPAGYLSRFYELLYLHRSKRAPTRAAWLQLEQERRRQGCRRFRSYGAFRVYLSRSRPAKQRGC